MGEPRLLVPRGGTVAKVGPQVSDEWAGLAYPIAYKLFDSVTALKIAVSFYVYPAAVEAMTRPRFPSR